MEQSNDVEAPIDRFQNMLKCLSKCKIDYINEIDGSKRLREINIKLETELKEARELEKSHRYHLLSSREMISQLQDTVSQLVYLKRDVKKLNDKIAAKNSDLAIISKEKEGMLQKHNETVEELRNSHKRNVDELTAKFEEKGNDIKQLDRGSFYDIYLIQYHSDTEIAQFTCVIEELRNKLKEMEAEHREKMNMVILENEEKVQRSLAQVTELQNQLARQTACANANINVYQRKLEELEEKLKQNEFKDYLAKNNYHSQFENVVERPYSVEREPYRDAGSISYNNMNSTQKTLGTPSGSHMKTQKPGINKLQVIYDGAKNPSLPNNDEKGYFSIRKKRKLYNEKDFLNM